MSRDSSHLFSQLERFRNQLLPLAENRCLALRTIGIEAEDVVQETLRRAYDKREQFRGSSDREFVGWLRAILATTLARMIRGKGHRTPVRSLESALDESSARLDLFLASRDPSPSRHVLDEERRERLYACLFQIPEDQRRAIILHHIEEKSVAEVAEIMSRTSAAVASLLHRGVEAMQKRMVRED